MIGAVLLVVTCLVVAAFGYLCGGVFVLQCRLRAAAEAAEAARRARCGLPKTIHQVDEEIRRDRHQATLDRWEVVG